MTTALVTQLISEEWVTIAPPSNRVSTLFIEVIADPSTIPASMRVTTLFMEVIADPLPDPKGAFLMVGA